jgi:uncharacterized surface protein with fasciclin (FAS1) repeats
MSNITQAVNVDKHLKTLKKGVHASDLGQLLSSTGPFTFFAPTDIAFEKLEKGLMEKLLDSKNRVELTDLLNNHIVNGAVVFKDLKDGDTLTTVNGKKLAVHVKDNDVHIGDVSVHTKDGRISNGVIFSVDSVLL